MNENKLRLRLRRIKKKGERTIAKESPIPSLLATLRLSFHVKTLLTPRRIQRSTIISLCISLIPIVGVILHQLRC